MIEDRECNRKEPMSVQKGVKRSKQNWLEYAQKKEASKIFPQIMSKELSTDSRSMAIRLMTRKQLLARMMEKKKKSMVSKYSSIFSEQASATKLPADSKAFAKELESILNES